MDLLTPHPERLVNSQNLILKFNVISATKAFATEICKGLGIDPGIMSLLKKLVLEGQMTQMF